MLSLLKQEKVQEGLEHIKLKMHNPLLRHIVKQFYESSIRHYLTCILKTKHSLDFFRGTCCNTNIIDKALYISTEV